jgi:hypothetical protein
MAFKALADMVFGTSLNKKSLLRRNTPYFFGPPIFKKRDNSL